MFSQKTLNIADPQSTCLLTLTVTPPGFREKPPPSDRTVTRLTLMIVRPHTRQVAEPEQREKILYNNTLLLFLSHSISAAVRKEKKQDLFIRSAQFTSIFCRGQGGNKAA